MRYLLFLSIFLRVFTAQAAEVHYVFYLHGQIVEGTTADPFSDIYGKYEYSNIIETLHKRGYVVISERRPANTDVRLYATEVAMQIDSLKKKGVPSEDIAVIGASKGAVIAMQVSDLVKDKNIRYILLAGCSEMAQDIYHFNLHGHILSIYEKSDQIGRSCKEIKAASGGISKFREIEIETGKKHGFLYRPIDEWVKPAFEWIEK